MAVENFRYQRSFVIAVETKSPNAWRGTTKWAAITKTRETRAQRETAKEAAYVAACKHPEWFVGGKLTITLRRVGVTLDDDNLPMACKAARDGVAEGLGFKDDRQSKSLAWRYEQRRASGQFGLEVLISLEAT